MPGRRLLAPTPHQNKDWPTQKKTLASDKHSRCLSPSAVRAQSLQKHSCRCAAIFAWIFDSAHHADQINFSERSQRSDVQQSNYRRLRSNAFSRLAWAELLLQQTRPSLQALQFWDHDNNLIWLRRFNICGSDAQNASQGPKKTLNLKNMFLVHCHIPAISKLIVGKSTKLRAMAIPLLGSMEFFFKKKTMFLWHVSRLTCKSWTCGSSLPLVVWILWTDANRHGFNKHSHWNRSREDKRLFTSPHGRSCFFLVVSVALLVFFIHCCFFLLFHHSMIMFLSSSAFGSILFVLHGFDLSDQSFSTFCPFLFFLSTLTLQWCTFPWATTNPDTCPACFHACCVYNIFAHTN